MNRRSAIILGTGGHARVVLATAQAQGYQVLGLVDIKEHPQESKIDNVNILGLEAEIFKYKPQEVVLLNGIGSVGDNRARKQAYLKFKNLGYEFPALIHPNSIIEKHVQLVAGVQVMAGAIIQVGSLIGENSIINTGAIVEHDCELQGHNHIAPGAVVCGGCMVGQDVHIGARATMIQGLKIAPGAIVGAGAVVINDISNAGVFVGVPAKEKI